MKTLSFEIKWTKIKGILVVLVITASYHPFLGGVFQNKATFISLSFLVGKFTSDSIVYI
jgi:hypothetical protein